MQKKATLIFLFALVFVFGCSSGGSTKSIDDVRTGTEAISMAYLVNNPPAIIHVEDGADNSFKVVLQVNNKGAYPQPEVGSAPAGSIYLSGYDPKIIEVREKGGTQAASLSGKTLEGKSTINPNGGIDFVEFDGKVNSENLNVQNYEPTLLATACYIYDTVASPQECIDPDPYSTISTKKVCTVSDISLTNQGAPVAVTSITEEALATKTQFRITIKNIGTGDVIKSGSIDKCNPFAATAKIEREDIDKVFVEEVKIGTKQLVCGPYAESSSDTGYMRLINKEGSIICKLDKTDYAQGANSAYTTPLKIRLSYGYKNTIDRKILIKKEGTNLPAQTPGSSSPVDSTQNGPPGICTDGSLNC